jgi:hypothetical protein
MATLQIRYLINWFFLVANFTFESLFVTLEELSIDLLHPPLLVLILSVEFIQLILFMLVE